MKRRVRWVLVLVASSIVGLGAVAAFGAAWRERAEDLCRKETASRTSVTWEWDEIAYVCDEAAAGERRTRVGVVDAFHGGGSQRHRPDR